MKLTSKAVVLGALAVLVTLTASCAPPAPVSPTPETPTAVPPTPEAPTAVPPTPTPVPKLKTLTMVQTEDPGTSDVQLSLGLAYWVGWQVYDGLVEAVSLGPGKGTELRPLLAERWEVSPDGKTYTFYLRKGVKFHNGEELTADDVAFTIERMLDPETKAMNTPVFEPIDGAKERLDGTADSVRGIKVIDRYTIELTLAIPYAPFLAKLAQPGAAIYNRKAVMELGDKWPQNPVGTGPFKFVSWKFNEEIVLEAFDGYFRGRPELDRLVARIVPDVETIRLLFEKGEIDILDLDYARSQIPVFLASPEWKDLTQSAPRVGTFYVAINHNIEPLNDVRVRQALQYAVDRDLILDSLFYGSGRPAKSFLPPDLPGYNADLPDFPYDPDKARALLKEAGLEDGFDMEIVYRAGRTERMKVSQALQAMWGEIGVRLTIKPLDSATFFALRPEGGLQAYLNEYGCDYNDPDYPMYGHFSPDRSEYRGYNYHNPEVEDFILNVGPSMTDFQERYRMYGQMDRIITHDDAAIVPLFNLDHLWVTQPWVKSFKVAWNATRNFPLYEIDVEPH